jgi:hypothetical protein
MSINAQVITGGLKKYPVLAISGLIVLMLLAVLYFRSDLIEAQQIEFDKYSLESARYRANIANYVQLQEQLNFLTQANKIIRDRALTVDGLAQNLQYFYRLEAEIGIKYLDLRPGTRAPGGRKAVPYVPLNYIVNVQGDFAQVMTFLRRLEQGAYFCRVNSAVASGRDSSVTLNLNIDFLGVQ